MLLGLVATAPRCLLTTVALEVALLLLLLLLFFVFVVALCFRGQMLLCCYCCRLCSGDLSLISEGLLQPLITGLSPPLSVATTGLAREAQGTPGAGKGRRVVPGRQAREGGLHEVGAREAQELGYPSPIHDTIEDTHKSFDRCSAAMTAKQRSSNFSGCLL